MATPPGRSALRGPGLDSVDSVNGCGKETSGPSLLAERAERLTTREILPAGYRGYSAIRLSAGLSGCAVARAARGACLSKTCTLAASARRVESWWGE
jgi:hypothetical protein